MYTNKQIWNVSFPILLSLLAQNIINVTDTAFLGHVGEVALGASAMGGLFYICVFTVAFGFSTGSQIVIARRNGEERYTDVGPVMIQGSMFLLAVAYFYLVLPKRSEATSCACSSLRNPFTKERWNSSSGASTDSFSRLSTSCFGLYTSASPVPKYLPSMPQ